MSSTVDQVKARLSIVDVVSPYVKLIRAGSTYKARCPFHSEKTPSFNVSPDRGTYHCFGCGVGGDIFSFVQDFEGLDFKDALHMLAVRAGVEIIPYQGNKEDSKNSKDQKDRLYKIIEEVVGIYKKDLDNNLPDSQKAKKYILTRGLNSQTLKTFSVGYARNEWRYLTTTLKERGYTDDELISSGLSVATTKGLYDKFR